MMPCLFNFVSLVKTYAVRTECRRGYTATHPKGMLCMNSVAATLLSVLFNVFVCELC